MSTDQIADTVLFEEDAFLSDSPARGEDEVELLVDDLHLEEVEAPRDEQSIEEYFDELMHRIGGEQRAERSVAEPAAEVAPPTKPVPSSEPVPETTDIPEAPETDEESETPTPRRTAPECSEKLAAMRDLAISSAHEAIGDSDAKWLERTYTDLLLAGVSLILTVMLLALSAGATSQLYWGALVSLGFSLFFGARVVRRKNDAGSFE